MKVAITGSSGHLGAAVVQALFKRNYHIKALARNGNFPFADTPVEIIKGDLFNADALHTLVKDCDALIHCAAVISVNGDPGGIVSHTNVAGTRLVMDAAKQAGVKRVIHISSIHAYQQRPNFEMLDEQREKVTGSAFAYDRSKKESEEVVLSPNFQNMEVLVLNPSAMVGPFDFKPSRVGRVIIDLYKGRLPFVFSGGFDFCDNRDVAIAAVNGLTQGKSGENYLLAGKWHSLKQLTTLISKVSGKKIRVFSFPPFAGKIGLPFVHSIARFNKKEPLYTIEALEALFTGNRNISSAKAMHELNYSPRPFEETLADTFNWFKQKGYLV